jgi:hypothetical protein
MTNDESPQLFFCCDFSRLPSPNVKKKKKKKTSKGQPFQKVLSSLGSLTPGWQFWQVRKAKTRSQMKPLGGER